MSATQFLEYERIRFLHLLMNGFLQYKEIYQAFEKNQEIPRCPTVESLCQEVFLELRDKAHSVFRRMPRSEEEARLHDYELLCDLVIGACYHELRQLQENLHLSKLYRPRYMDLKKQMHDASFEEYFLIGENLIAEAEGLIPKNMRWIWQLLLEALALVKSLLGAQVKNRVLLRYLIRNIDLIEKVYDGEAVDGLFGEMFSGGYPEALLRSSQDLIESAHFHSALDHLRRLRDTLPSQNRAAAVDLSEVVQALRRIQGEGKLLRDNELVARSQGLLEAFEKAASTP